MMATDTADATVTPPPVSRGAPPRHLDAHPYWRIIRRWVWVVAVAIWAYWQTLENLLVEIRAQTVTTFLLPSMVLAAIATIGITLRRKPDLPIYDRQTDDIVGSGLLVLALCFQALLRPRYETAYLVLHLDLVSMWLFLMGGFVLLFGLRPVLRYGWVWVLLAVMSPYAYRLAVIALGGSFTAAGLVMIVYSALAAAVAVGRTRRRAIFGALLAAFLGLFALAVVRFGFPTAPIVAYQLVPSFVGAFTVGFVMYTFQRRDRNWWPTIEPQPSPLTAPNVLRAAIGFAMVGTVIHFFPPPAVAVDAGPTFAGLDTRPPLSVPPDWIELNNRYFPWVTRMYGPDAVGARQELVQRTGSTRFDKDATPRRVMVDAIETAHPLTLSIYSATSDYRVTGDRVSTGVNVALPHGITGTLQTAVDDKQFLTYNRLTWRWNNGRQTQVVSLLSVDNHQADAPFPEPQLTTMRNLGIFATVLLRGNLVTEDLAPTYKDRDLLAELASELIDTQLHVSSSPVS